MSSEKPKPPTYKTISSFFGGAVGAVTLPEAGGKKSLQKDAAAVSATAASTSPSAKKRAREVDAEAPAATVARKEDDEEDVVVGGGKRRRVMGAPALASAATLSEVDFAVVEGADEGGSGSGGLSLAEAAAASAEAAARAAAAAAAHEREVRAAAEAAAAAKLAREAPARVTVSSHAAVAPSSASSFFGSAAVTKGAHSVEIAVSAPAPAPASASRKAAAISGGSASRKGAKKGPAAPAPATESTSAVACDDIDDSMLADFDLEAAVASATSPAAVSAATCTQSPPAASSLPIVLDGVAASAPAPTQHANSADAAASREKWTCSSCSTVSRGAVCATCSAPRPTVAPPSALDPASASHGAAAAPAVSPARKTAAASAPAPSSTGRKASPAKASSAPRTAPATATVTPAPLVPLFGANLAPPKGKAGCLKDTKWVLTGELSRMTRDQAVACITGYDGQVMSGVSGKVNCLLMGGRLEDGRPVTSTSKWREAQAKIAAGQKLVIYDEDAFYELVESTLGSGVHEVAEEQRTAAAAAAVKLSTASAAAVAGGGVGAALNTSTSSAKASGAASSPPPVAASAGAVAAPTSGGQLWVDKYKPRTITDLVGNQRELQAMDAWLAGWAAAQAARDAPGAKGTGAGFRALLVSGPPGIGKTSAAALLARRHGYEPMELNASDARSKKMVQAALGGVLDSTVINFAPVSASTAPASAKRRLVILDEVDGLSSSDRGGNPEIAKLIKGTRVPIICICNDRQKPSVRTLAKYCLDIKFSPPTTSAIAARLQGVAAGEGIHMEPAAVAALVESVGGDLRQALNTMQVWALTERSLTGDGLRARRGAIGKDMNLRLDAGSAAPRMFDSALPLATREDLFFVDYDLIPLHIQQMYAATIDKASGPDAAKLQRLYRAASAISDADLFQAPMLERNAWGLLPSVALAYVRAAGWASGPPAFVMFPTILGKMSTARKRSRLVAEMGAAMAAAAGGGGSRGQSALRLDYMSTLRSRLFAGLAAANAADKDAVAAAARDASELLDEYNLSKDDMMVTMGEELVFDAPGPEFRLGAKALPAAVKAAFTREYNRLSHNIQRYGGLEPAKAGAAAMKKAKGPSAGGAKAIAAAAAAAEGYAASDDDEGADGEDGEADDSSADGDGDDDDAAAAKKFAAAASRKKSAGGSKGAAARGGKAASGRGKAKSAPRSRAKAAAASDDDDDEDDDDVDVIDF